MAHFKLRGCCTRGGFAVVKAAKPTVAKSFIHLWRPALRRREISPSSFNDCLLRETVHCLGDPRIAPRTPISPEVPGLNLRRWAPWFWAAVVAVVVIHNGYLWWHHRLVPDTDILALLPVLGRDPVLQRALPQMVEAAEQRVIVLIGATDWDDARRAAAVYRQSIAPFPHLLSAAEAITERTRTDWLETFKNHRLTLLTSEDDTALRNQAPSYWVDRALAKLYSPFAGPQPLAWREDPFGLFNNWLLARAQETPVRPRDGELSVSAGERHYVVLPLTLRVPAFALAGQQAVMPVLEQARQAVWQTTKGIEVIQAGVILHAAAAASQAQREMSIIGIGSMAGILFLIWMTFHSLKPIILVTLSMAIGCLGALSISSWLLFERIHLITLVFGASLIGVAQDYGIYFFCQRASAANDSLDSWRLLRRILPAMILTMVTTLIGYLGLVLTPFPGLRQMALFSCTGLIFAWLTVVCWFPAWARPTTLGLQRWAGRYGGTMTAWPRLASDRRTLFATLGFVGLLLFGGSGLSVQDDIRALQKPPQNLLDDQVKLGKILDLATPVQFYLLRAASAEALLQWEEALTQRLDPLVQQNQIRGYQAISNLLPSASLQASRRQLIERSLLNDDGALARVAAKLGEAPSWVSAARERLLAAVLPITIDDFLKSPASQPWRHLWVGQVGDQHASIVAIRADRSKAPIMTYGQADRADVRLGDVALVEGGLAFRLSAGAATADVRLPLAGRHNAWHAAAAAAVGLTLGVPLDEAAAALALAAPVKGRLVWREAGGVRILDDTYNANPVSVRAALDALREAPGGGRRWVIVAATCSSSDRSPNRPTGRSAAWLAALPVAGVAAVGSAIRLTAEAARTGGCADVATFAEPEAAAAHMLARVAPRGPRADQGLARDAVSTGRSRRCRPRLGTRPEAALMLYHLLYRSRDVHVGFNVFRYITFRTAFAALTALLISFFLGPWLIRKPGAPDRRSTSARKGPSRIRPRPGTPTMGGLLILVSVVIPTLLWADLPIPTSGSCSWSTSLRRDRLRRRLSEARKKRNLGLTTRQKFLAAVRGGAGRGRLPRRVPADGVTRRAQRCPFVEGRRSPISAGSTSLFAMLDPRRRVERREPHRRARRAGHRLACIVAAVTFTVLTYVAGQRAVADYLRILGAGRRRAGGLLRRDGRGVLGFLWFNAIPPRSSWATSARSPWAARSAASP